MTSITLSPIPSAPLPGDRGPWLQTHSGGRWYYLDPRPEDVGWRDIAHALGQLPQFGGHLTHFYSVAQHSYEVANLVSRDARPHALLDNASVAFLGQWPAPLKEALACYGKRPALRHLGDISALAIHRAAGLEFPPQPDIASEIKHAHRVLLATEARDFLAQPLDWSTAPPKPLRRKLKPLPWYRAADNWLSLARFFLPRFDGGAG